MPLEPPYGIIGDQLKRGNVIPFLGAGASLCGRPEGEVRFDEASSAFLPTGGELAHLLAEESSFPGDRPGDRDNLAKVASYYEVVVEREVLRNRLREIFCKPRYRPGPLHEMLADLEVPPLIVTTNYDNLIESAFEARGKPYHLVVYPADEKEMKGSVLWWPPGAEEPRSFVPGQLPLGLTDTAIVYKMHGTVDRRKDAWDHFVITEEDYVDFLARMTAKTAIPSRFMAEFRRRRFLFLGYGMNDWNLRVLLQNLRTVLSGAPAGDEDGADAGSAPKGGSLRAWAIQHGPSQLEQELWQKRNVNIYDKDLDEFAARLREPKA